MRKDEYIVCIFHVTTNFPVLLLLLFPNVIIIIFVLFCFVLLTLEQVTVVMNAILLKFK